MTAFNFTSLPLILVDKLTSTNNYATGLLASGNLPEGAVILTFRQTHGRGHGKNVWESEDFKNLTFSMVLFPGFLPASRQFLLSQVVSLGLYDFLVSKTGKVSIKWPNDLLINEKKVAGILIENSVTGTHLSSSVIGIGININQPSFPDHLSQATSLTLSTGKIFSLDLTLKEITDEILKWYQLLKQGRSRLVRGTYLQHLFRLGEKSLFRREGRLFEAKITGIDDYGQLQIENSSGEKETCPFKSLEFVF